jgi:CheY-like chemotaxis protein
MPGIEGTETILLVDDEVTIRTVVPIMLTRYGYEVIVASSGEEALRLFEQPNFRVDLLLVDVAMPGMNGVELAEHVNGLHPALPVLYCSAYSSDEKLRPKIARGLRFLPKPFSSLQLTQAIRDALDNLSLSSMSA